jgi:hypothetical protein
VVVALLAVTASTTRGAGFESDTVSRLECRDVRTDVDDLAGALVAEDEWVLDDDVPDAAVLVVVDVGAADSHFPNGDENVVRTGRWPGAVLKLELVRFD